MWLLKQDLAKLSGISCDEQSLVLMVAKDTGELLEDADAALWQLGIRSGSDLLLSVLTSKVAPSAPAPDGSQLAAAGANPRPPQHLGITGNRMNR